MAEEPTLPRLPTVSWHPGTHSLANTRKRSRDTGAAPPLFSNSSDPAVFSSDDDPNVENYAHGRHRKRRYVGSWYQQQPASSDSAFSPEVRPLPKPKRKLERHFDSGVWMGSDGSVDTDDSFLDLEPPTEPRLPELRQPHHRDIVSPAEDLARQKIQAAIDEGREDIDLSSLGLRSLSNSTIAQLAEFSCIPLVTEGIPFEPKDPSLRLYLFGNPLLRAPRALFDLEFLTILSLCNTQITEIPASIKNLRNLQTLNLSLNHLRYLPAEFLDLLKYPTKLAQLNVHPNPFYQPDRLPQLALVDRADGEIWRGHGDDVLLIHEHHDFDGSIFRRWVDIIGGSRNGNAYRSRRDDTYLDWQASILARSPIQYNDSRGVVLSNFRLPSHKSESSTDVDPEDVPNIIIETEDLAQPLLSPRVDRNVPDYGMPQSRVLSLVELALQSCSRAGRVPDLTSYLPDQTPPYLRRLVEQAVEQDDGDAHTGVPCSICGRKVRVPTIQWIEWWDLSHLLLKNRIRLSSRSEEQALPFLYRGCSWSCVPQPTHIGQLLPGIVKWGLEKAIESG